MPQMQIVQYPYKCNALSQPPSPGERTERYARHEQPGPPYRGARVAQGTGGPDTAIRNGATGTEASTWPEAVWMSAQRPL